MALADDGTQANRHALWLLCSQDSMDEAFHLQLLNHTDPTRRAWGVRMCGQMGSASKAIYDKLIALASDPAPEVRVQIPVAAGRLKTQDPLPILAAMLHNPENAKDPIIPNIVYNNFKPLLVARGDEVLKLLGDEQTAFEPFSNTVVKWVKECAAGSHFDVNAAVKSLTLSLKKAGEARFRARALTDFISACEAASAKHSDCGKAFDKSAQEAVEKVAGANGEAQASAAIVALWWHSPDAVAFARKAVADGKTLSADRLALLRGLSEAHDAANIDNFAALLNDNNAPLPMRREAAAALGGLGQEAAAQTLLKDFKMLPPELKAAVVNSLVGNAASAKVLLDALEQKTVAASEINANNARAVVQLNNADLTARLTKAWGKVKLENERDPARVQVVNKMRDALAPFTIYGQVNGDPMKGWKVFEKNCQQCHKIYGKGNEVGPDLTGVGRDNLDLILNNVLDPNLVVGEGYFQHFVKTKDGISFFTRVCSPKKPTKRSR